MIEKIRSSFFVKVVSVYTILNLLAMITGSNQAFALTSGPVDINVQSFEPASASEMVNVSTGDFVYNIPLLDVDGYPINLSYHGGVGMEQEASVVGLGWTINPGSVNRMKRGLPDDFSGDEITTEINMRPNTTIGVRSKITGELIGKVFEGKFQATASISGSFGLGAFYNNYKGLGTEVLLGASASVGVSADLQGLTPKLGGSLGVSVNSNSQNGATITPTYGIVAGLSGNKAGLEFGITRGFSMNSTNGLQYKIEGNSYKFSMKNRLNIGSNGVIAIPQGTQTYTPSVGISTFSQAGSGSFKAGIEGCWFGLSGDLQFYWNQTGVANTLVKRKSYGYFNSHNNNSSLSIHDFNREMDGLYSENTPNLAIVQQTFDMFSATGQGIGMSFRGHRSDVGATHDPEVQNFANSFSASFDFTYSDIFSAGVNFTSTFGNGKSGKWLTRNESLNTVKFRKTNSSFNGTTALYEPYYFKKTGNKSIIDESFYDRIGRDAAIRQNIGSERLLSSFTNDFDAYNLTVGTNSFLRDRRDYRNIEVASIDGKQAKVFGVSRNKKIYEMNNFYFDEQGFPYTTETYTEDESKDHHLTEHTIYGGDGSKYVYGLPVKNYYTKEVAFNISQINNYPPNTANEGASVNYTKGLISYIPDMDNSANNQRGVDFFFNRKTTPEYNSNYLLTHFFTSNYVDLSGDGPTKDDLGGYVKFNYTKVKDRNGDVVNQKWRIPFDENMAFYNENLKASQLDDMATYVYGEREQFYIHSIESKNYVAQFYYASRHDNYGVKNENGGLDTEKKPSKRLVKIELYSIQQKLNQTPENPAIPLKTVHFEYDYSLCQNVPNNDGLSAAGEQAMFNEINDGGKLTLKAIYFSYENSKRGSRHKYVFNYQNNYSYNPSNNDRWGVYKNNTATSANDLSTLEYPYSKQNKNEMDNNSSAWLLNQVSLPSGSTINVEYESDDYKYIQDKEAAQMYKVLGFSNNQDINGLTNDTYSEDDSYDYLFIDLDRGINADNLSEANSKFKNNYLPKQGEKMYFKMLIDVTSSRESDAFEFVPGYADVDRFNSGVVQSSLITVNGEQVYTKAFIKLKSVGVEDPDEHLSAGSTNDIVKASWQFTRKYHLDQIFPSPGYPNSIYLLDGNIDLDQFINSGEGIVRSIRAHSNNVRAFTRGFNGMLKLNGHCKKIKPTKSWVRLYTGDYNKLGGGHRVKSIRVNDNWNNTVSNETSSTYGTQYKYVTEENGQMISSGVAQYEPINSGADEISLRQPDSYSNEVKYRVNDHEFQEKPFGETIFATPTVAYSKVEVSNIDYVDENNNPISLSKNGTGKTVYQYYTSKDFPVIVEKTPMKKIPVQETWSRIFTSGLKSFLTLSQGYSIKVNDMHGKFKSKHVYREGSNPNGADYIYGIEYEYFSKNNNRELDNEVNTVNQAGVIEKKTIGLDVDFSVDQRSNDSYSSEIDILAQLDYSAGCSSGMPIPIPSIWGHRTTDERKLFTTSSTKIIQTYGLVKQIKLFDKGRLKKTSNLLFDQKTGSPIVTRVTHEQGEGSIPIYQYDYPAYWQYEGMGHASENAGAKFSNLIDQNGKIEDNYKDFVFPGDEIMVQKRNGDLRPELYWVVENESNGDYYLLDRLGNNIFANLQEDELYIVKRSGRKNYLGSTMTSITSLDPLNLNANQYRDGIGDKTLNVSSIDFTNKASAYLGSETPPPNNKCSFYPAIGDNVNPYVLGLLGNWNVKSSYVFDGTRDQTNDNIREDGVLEDYIPFFALNSNNKWVSLKDDSHPFHSIINIKKWIKASEGVLFDSHGYNLESKDALGNSASILLGYNNTLKIAQGVNTKHHEFGFDGFEDYAYQNLCMKPHFGYQAYKDNLTDEEAHSGRYSLEVSSGTTASFEASIKETSPENSTPHQIPYLIQEDEVVESFYIERKATDQKFVVSAWIKEQTSGDGFTTTYNTDQFEVKVNGQVVAGELSKSNIIDGWQRVSKIITIPGSSADGSIELNLKANNSTVYFDDIRIQPFNSEMVTYVMDPLTLRLWTVLDSRNFGTFYKYDEEGSLISILQETEDGKITVKENRGGIKIDNN